MTTEEVWEHLCKLDNTIAEAMQDHGDDLLARRVENTRDYEVHQFARALSKLSLRAMRLRDKWQNMTDEERNQ